jgi:hypothetical protein
MADITKKELTPYQAYLQSDASFKVTKNGATYAIGLPHSPTKSTREGVVTDVPLTLVKEASSPPKASAAPTGDTGYQFVGLVEALNSYQLDLVKKKTYDKADVYEILFDPVSLGDSKVKKPGGTDRSKTAAPSPNSAKAALDPKNDKVNSNSQNWNVTAGTQVIQVIDQVMRSSAYISDQALVQIDPNTQKAIPSPGTGTGITAWYQITASTQALEYDIKRRDYAYKMTYLITPYAITQMASEYFPDSRYRGSHKSYNYWFTGQNTEILSYEQTFDSLYYLVFNGESASNQPSASTRITLDYRDQYSRIAMPTTEQKTGQQTGTYTNAAADSAADYLYSPKDLSKIHLRIAGDPAWLQQDQFGNFSFSPFNDDGTINFDSQQIVFDISWNQPTDYDFTTGVMNVNSANGRSKQNNVYTPAELTSYFSKGKFEQEIHGNQFVEFKKEPSANATVARSAAKVPIIKKPNVNVSPDTLKPSEVLDRAAVGSLGSIVRPNGTSFNPYYQLRAPGGAISGARVPLAPNNPLNPGSYGNG